MKRIFAAVILFVICAAACIGKTEIQDADLSKMVEEYTFPVQKMEEPAGETEVQGLPLKLTDKLRKAVYDGNSDELINELNDKSLMITTADFNYEANTGEDAGLQEQELNEALKNGTGNYDIYQCDIDRDGDDEIIVIDRLKYDYSYSNCAYLLEKSGDVYKFSSYEYLGYYRCFAIFQYEDTFYLVANYDDYTTKMTKALGVFSLYGESSSFMWLLDKTHTYLVKTSDEYQFHLLYKNKGEPVADAVQAYIEEIGTDLIYADRKHSTFWGDEMMENSFDPRNDSAYPDDYEGWIPEGYELTQSWYKIMEGKKIIFSLLRKNLEETYLLDTRIYEKEQTTILMDHMIDLKWNVTANDYWEYDDSNWMAIDYEDPDIQTAIPDNIGEMAEDLAGKVRGDFEAVDYAEEDIPNGLIVLLEDALFHGNLYDMDLDAASYEMNRDDFYDTYGTQIYYDSKADFDRFVQHIYGYTLDNRKYCLMVADSGGSARFVDITLYEETEELVALDHLISLDLNARVAEYEGTLFLIEASYNYYSKYTDTVIAHRLVSDGIGSYVRITLEPKDYEWESIYNSHMPCEKNVAKYIESIKTDLMLKSPINDDIILYTGDEKQDFDPNRIQRLKSVGGLHDYYEIDYNNDGINEYFTKRFWFPSNYTTLYLINQFYEFTDQRIVELSQSFDNAQGTLVQLWFKEIDGKIVTFRLFLGSGYNYYLNVSLIEGKEIAQVQTYIIAPKCEFTVMSGEHDNEIR